MTNTQSLGTIEATNPVLAVAPLKEETEMLRATDKITALYCRLSVEDLKEDKKGGKEDESNSIQNQHFFFEVCILGCKLYLLFLHWHDQSNRLYIGRKLHISMEHFIHGQKRYLALQSGEGTRTHQHAELCTVRYCLFQFQLQSSAQHLLTDLHASAILKLGNQ